MKKNRLRKITGSVILIILIILFIRLFPTFLKLTSEEGRLELKKIIENLGIKGAILIIALEISKIILVFLPGEPIELLAGMCYGPWIGLLIIYIGVTISNIIIIFLVKKYGVKFVQDVVKEEKIKKINQMIDDNNDRTEITLFVLYFLPFLPKDFITYVASLLPISNVKLLIISIIARFTAVFSSVLVGSKILDGKIISIILIYTVTYIISGIIAMIYKKTSVKEKLKGEENE